MIERDDLATGLKVALEAAGADEISLVESDFEAPYLEVVMDAKSGVRIEVWFEEGEPLILRLDAKLISDLSATESDNRGDLEFVLRVLNGMNRLEGTPWKFWLKGMGVEFEGAMGGKGIGEIWATWSISAELVEIDDLPDLCHRFSVGLRGLDVPLPG